jgi:hypothetical protein
MLLSVDSGGTLHYENAGAHDASHDTRFYTKNEVDVLLANLTTQIVGLQAQISALQNAALQVRINGVLQPCSRLSFDSGSISTMYTGSVDHCHVWVGHVSPPLDPPN